MTHDDDGHWWETLRTPEQWAQVPATRRMWYNPDSTEETEERQQTAHEMGLVVQVFMLSSLTLRQRQVVELYCLEGLTQVEVATALRIERCESRVLFLPPYSPDFNLIEKMWSKIKSLLRKLEARSQGELSNAITQAFRTVTSEDARG